MDFTLVNQAPISHSLDFHAAAIAPDKYDRNLTPNNSIHSRFVARVPGAFMYHCGTAPVALHIASGMYGALVVDPIVPRPKARELVFVQSEFYLSATKNKDGAYAVDWNRMLSLAPDHVVVNAGPNRISSFHVVGAIFEIRLKEPGDYPFVTHAFADATKGAVGVLRAVGAGR